MFNFFKKNQEEISRTTPGYEETERKTPITGVILLFMMFIAGMFFGWRALDDLGRIPQAPEPLSACASRYENQGYLNGDSVYLEESPVRPFNYQPLYYEYDSGKCQFSALEKEYNIAHLFEPRMPLEKELKPFRENLNATENSLNEIRYQLQRATGEYGIGLQEKQAGIVEETLFPTGLFAQSISSLRTQEAEMSAKKSGLDNQISAINTKIKKIDEKLKEAYKPVFKEQNKRLRWYEFKVFILQFLVIFPFFLLVLRGCLRLHRKNSPYTIIFTAMLAVASLLFLRIILFWFWGLFLARILEVLIKWFDKYEIIRTLIFYGGMVLSFAIFGGAVYWLQKKVFDPRRVTIRRFRAKQCPHCQTNLDLTGFYCPNCGSQIKEKCEKCGQARFVGMPNCPNCGDKKI